MPNKKILFLFKLLCCVGMLQIGYGCAPSAERYHPDHKVYLNAFDTLLLMPPEVLVVEEMSDGSRLHQKERSRKVRSLVQEIVGNVMTDKRYRVRNLEGDALKSDEVRQLNALYRSVNRSIQLHTYGPQPFPSKKRSFEYAVGSVEKLLDTFQADALVLVEAKEMVSTLHRSAWMSIAVIEPQGRIVWYSAQGAKENLQPNDNELMETLIVKTLQHFPGNQQ